jgi:predicted phosphodiesterase
MKADLILTADWHLRDDSPPCRVDDFQESQWMKVAQVAILAEEHDCPVVHAGDLFHHWKPSPYLLATAMRYLPQKFFTVAGQHDLPQHSMELYTKCGMNTLAVAKAIIWIMNGGNFGQGVGVAFRTNNRQVGVWHHFVWDGEHVPWPDCKEVTARQVLKDNPQFDLIVTGDYHKPFTYEYKGRLLVNCGCLTRQVADYSDHRPRVWLWNAEANTVSPFYLIAEKGVVSRAHLAANEERDKRLDAFISRLSDEWEVGISFEENLKRFISTNQLRKSVVDLIYKAINE